MDNEKVNLKPTPKKNVNKNVISFLITTSLIILLIILLYFYFNYYFLGGRIIKYIKNNEPISILLLGLDNVKDSRKTDTMLIGIYNPSSKRFGLISIPRDLKVDLESRFGHETIKINAIYSKYGINKLLSVINNLTGTDVTFYTIIDLSALIKIVDLMDGVELYIDEKMNYKDQAGNLFIDLPIGIIQCDGLKAMQFIRYRKDERGDLGRLDRQYEFILSLAQKAIYKKNILTNFKLLKTIFKYMKTNMNFNDIINLIRSLSTADLNNIENIKIPGKFINIYGIDYIETNPEYTKKIVQEFLDKISLIKNDFLPNEIKVQVLNGSGKIGAAKIIRDKLVRNGYNVVEFGNADSQNYPNSIILNCSGNLKKVLKVSQILKCNKIYNKINKFIMIDVIIIVGKDYKNLI